MLGGTLVNLRTPKIATGVLHGILTALVTGILIVGIASAGLAGHEPNTTKIAVKLVVALVVATLVILGVRKPSRVTTGYLGAIAGPHRAERRDRGPLALSSPRVRLLSTP